jgi:hypothetical protein
MNNPNPVCLRPDCGKPAKHRGLCVNCYQSARLLVSKNKTTWDVLVAAGKCHEAHGGPGSKSDAAKWLLD